MAKGKSSSGYDASKIKILGGIDAVRLRPGMYIGTTGKAGLHHLIYEVVDNSVDEALAGHCDTVKVILRKDKSATIEDNGRGIPFDIHPETKRPAAEVVLTTLHAGGKFGDSVYKVAGGLHGVGVSVVNALSEWMEVEIYREGKVYTQRFNVGAPGKEKIVASKDKERSGTVVTFLPDKKILDDIIFDYETVKHRLQEVAFLNKGLKVSLQDERDGKAEEFNYEGGVIEFVKFLNKGKEVVYAQPAHFFAEKEHIYVEIALQHCKDYYDENVFSYVNCIRTREGGTHLVGFKSALTKALNNYAKKNNILKENEVLAGGDVREGLTAVINLRIPNPQFEGQTKTKLGNSEVKGLVDSIVTDGLGAYLDKNPASARAIIEKSLLAFRVRAAARKAQELERKKSALDTATLPGKLADCSESDPAKCEIFIVEGDSAGGCFSGETEIALVDGRNLSFKELLIEWQAGKTNYCYTIKDDLSIGIEKIVRPRVTKNNAEVIKITLDNNQSITCTPDHRFMLRDGSFIEAGNLSPSMSIMPLNRKLSERKGRITIAGYEMALNPKTHKWIFTHVLADEFNLKRGKYSKGDGDHKHHADFRKLNNSPDNIVRMGAEAHMALHRGRLKHTLHRPDAIEKCNLIKRKPEYREKLSRKIREEYGRILSAKAKKQWINPGYVEFMKKKFKEFYDRNSDYREKSLATLVKAQREYWGKPANREKQSERVRNYFANQPEVRALYSDKARKQWGSHELLAWRSAKTRTQWTDLVSLETLKNRFFGGNEAELIEAAQNYNHKIIKIEKAKEKIDVYDIEVPNTHNFALASGIFVHNSAKQGRDRKFQAILPLKGKILNVEKARLDKILANNEIRTLITAIGPGVVTVLKGDGNGETETELTPEELHKRLRYHKIILLCDADVDGAHIRTLILTFFYRYARELVENGNLYIAQPPLYLLKKGKAQYWLHSDKEMEAKIKEVGKEGTSLQRYKGLGEMNPVQLWETTLNPETRTMLKVTLDDAEVADEIFKVLMGSEVEPRREFIEKHAKDVKRLDI